MIEQQSNVHSYLMYSSHQVQSNRPRSNSEGKSKKPNLIMSTLRKSMYLPWSSSSSSSNSTNHNSSHHQNSPAPATDHHNHHLTINHTDPVSCPVTPCHHDPSSPCPCADKPRSRSGSGGSDRVNANPVSRVIDIFRNRSLSVGYNEIRRVSYRSQNSFFTNFNQKLTVILILTPFF
jgi:hypothetical protein